MQRLLCHVRLLITCGLTIAVIGLAPAAARASRSQLAIIEDPADLTTPQQTVAQFRALGANTVRLDLSWTKIAPDPRSARRPSFAAANPNAYAAAGWAPYDAVIRTAQQDGMRAEIVVAGGAPRWAEGAGIPGPGLRELEFAWKPDAGEYGQFVRAVGERYSGHFVPPGSASPLPAVRLWAIFNEPNFGEDLGPQAIDGSRVSVAPMMYRRLVDAGWRALHATGHGRDTILIGELAARGIADPATKAMPNGEPGDYGQTKPLSFLRTLYCLGGAYTPLRGSPARSVGCPATTRGSRRFRAANPGLFDAGGMSDHPFGDNRSPTVDGSSDPQFATFAHLGDLERTLDRITHAYGSRTRYPIYNDEYGYLTSPPAARHYVTARTAAGYLNEAEYLSWKNPRIRSYSQYLLADPPAGPGPYAGFASGLELPDGRPKATYAAYRLPLYLPRTSLRPNADLEIWGAARPAGFMQRDGDGPQTVAIQLDGTTVATARPAATTGYFDVHVTLARGGPLHLAYTYPAADPFLPLGVAGSTVDSRTVTVRAQ